MLSKLAKVSILSITIFGAINLEAQAPLDLVVKLEKIERIKAQEDQGDELYFSITEFSSIQRSNHYQVPSFPTHWLSAHLNQVKNVNLWQKEIQPDESIELIFSLVERDVPPWNVDDLIGSVKLKMMYRNNQLVKEWSIPNSENTAKIPDEKNGFSLTGDDSRYEMVLKLEEVRPDLIEFEEG